MTKTQCAHSSHSSRCHIEWQVIVRCCIYRSLTLNNSLISRFSQDTTYIQVKDRKRAKGLTSYITKLMSCLAVKPGIWLFTLSNHLCPTHRTLSMEFWRTLSELHVNIRSNVTDQANTNLLIWYFAPLIRCEKLQEPNSKLKLTEGFFKLPTILLLHLKIACQVFKSLIRSAAAAWCSSLSPQVPPFDLNNGPSSNSWCVTGHANVRRCCAIGNPSLPCDGQMH